MKRTTTTRGVWRDQAAFERITDEFAVPPQVAEKGIDAIIRWVDEVKGPVAKVAIAAGLISLIMTKEEKEQGAFGITGDAELTVRKSFLARLKELGLGSDLPFSGVVLDKDLEVLRGGGQSESIPSQLILSITQIDKTSHFFTLLDGTRFHATLKTNPILFQTHAVAGALLSSPKPSKIMKIKPERIENLVGAKPQVLPANTSPEANNGSQSGEFSEKLINLRLTNNCS